MIDKHLLYPNLCYLATPYSKYPAGMESAFVNAATIAGDLLAKYKINVYSPIAHTHPMAEYAGLDHGDHGIWLPFDELMMRRCDVILVATVMEGWDTSKGVAHEIAFFLKEKKPVFHLSCVRDGSFTFTRQM